MEFITLSVTLGDKLDKLFYGFDMSVFSFFGSLQCEAMNYISKFISHFGDELFMFPIIFFAVVLCLFKKTRKYGIAICLAAIIGTGLTNVLFKPLVLRIRPYNTLQSNPEYFAWYKFAGMLSESDYSFPSGHSTGAFEVATASALCLRSANYKKLSYIPPLIAFGTMCSRIYLMVHYPTDVIAGALIGIGGGFLGYFIAKYIMIFVEKNKSFSKLNDTIDLERPFKTKPSKRTISLIITAVVVLTYFITIIPTLSEGGEQSLRCAYNGDDYKCYNEAKSDDEDYPPIDGRFYCKIHWKQISEE